MVTLQGSKITALVHPWSVIVRMVLLPFDLGSFVTKSMESVEKGVVVSSGRIGCNGSQF